MASEARARQRDRRALCRRHRAGLPGRVRCRTISGGPGRTLSEVSSGITSREDAPAGIWGLCHPAPAASGLGKPETFNFLGFTHICGKKRSNGWFTVLRHTIRQRLRAKLQTVKVELRRRMHHPLREQGAWLRSVVAGHVRYYGVPTNRPALRAFRTQVAVLWFRTLHRRSQRQRLTWARMRRHVDRWLPPARVCHPYPLRRLGVIT